MLLRYVDNWSIHDFIILIGTSLALDSGRDLSSLATPSGEVEARKKLVVFGCDRYCVKLFPRSIIFSLRDGPMLVKNILNLFATSYWSVMNLLFLIIFILLHVFFFFLASILFIPSYTFLLFFLFLVK